MEKLIVQRIVQVWIEDVYEVEEINDETINEAINGVPTPCDNSEYWDTIVDLGSYEIFDSKRNLIKSITPNE